AATMSSLPSCVTVMPVGSASTGKTFFKVICPRPRLSTATPFDDFGFELVSETKSQQPSGDETVLNGWPGSWTYETGAPNAASHCDSRPCALAVAARHSVSSAAPARPVVLVRLMCLKN